MSTTSTTKAKRQQRALIALAKRRSLFRNRKTRVPRNILKQTSTRVKMKYYDSFSITQATANLATSYVYRYTDINDPQYATGGHQPWGHDTYATLFQHYMVMGCTAKVTATVLGESSRSTSFWLTNHAAASGTNIDELTELGENPASKGAIINGFRPITLKTSYSKNKIFRNTKNAELTAPMNSPPTEQYYLIISLCNIWPMVLSPEVQFTIELNYDVLLTENKALIQS